MVKGANIRAKLERAVPHEYDLPQVKLPCEYGIPHYQGHFWLWYDLAWHWLKKLENELNLLWTL